MIQTLIRVYHSTFIIITFKLIRRETVHGLDFAMLVGNNFVIKVLCGINMDKNFNKGIYEDSAFFIDCSQVIPVSPVSDPVLTLGLSRSRL